ncbi:hypothetical protein DICVIV_00567 [Dictyocaulus viviparus]|uniref:Uncharacterized protein n=1 Tax=Dictyocaulus viviparus TaxID=29172 RepID=A0A0D8YF43_DICVI|nr:hypothetical protein DICVIV_00567 [Dictyocaulus viviparus]
MLETLDVRIKHGFTTTPSLVIVFMLQLLQADDSHSFAQMRLKRWSIESCISIPSTLVLDVLDGGDVVWDFERGACGRVAC